MRLGFLGTGWIGRHRMEAVVRSGVAEVAAVADPAPERAEAALALAPGATLARSLEELLACGVDGVVIATPSALHGAQSRLALERGVAVFCQKPVGRTAAETREVVAAARRADLLLGADFCYRHVAIALSAEPEILVADEPTTALDVTVQAQILEVLDRLRASRGMAILLSTHDLGIVAGRADRVAVMYAGQIVEEAPTGSLFARPSHPYTQGLFASVPRISGPVSRLTPISGSVPPPTAWPSGCRFRPRCPQAFAKSETMPPLLPVGPDHRVRCWLAEEPAGP